MSIAVQFFITTPGVTNLGPSFVVGSCVVIMRQLEMDLGGGKQLLEDWTKTDNLYARDAWICKMNDFPRNSK
jgi:hypothetical protein